MATQRISHTARLPVCGVPARASLSPPHAATSPSSRRAALGSFSTRPHLVLASTPAPRADLVNRYLVVMGLSPTKKATTTTRSSLPREQGLRGRARHRLQVRHGLAAKGRRHRYMRPPPLLHQATVVATRATVAGAGADATCGRDRCYIRPPSMLQQVAALATRTTVVAPMLRAVAAIATRTIAMAPMLHAAVTIATYGQRRCYKGHRGSTDATCGRRHCYIRPPPLLQGPPQWCQCYMRPPRPFMQETMARATAVDSLAAWRCCERPRCCYQMPTEVVLL
jgi:hypothetical protein